MNQRQRKARRTRRAAEAANLEAHDTTDSQTTTEISMTNNTQPQLQSKTATPEDPRYVIGPPPAPKRIVELTTIGSHRGAELNIPAIADFNRQSTAAELVPLYLDALPGRALAMKERAAQQGVAAHALEAKGEDIVASAAVSSSPVVLHVDRASAIAAVLRSMRPAPRSVLGYLVLGLPAGKMYGFAFVLEPRDELAREGAITFFEELARASERNTSDALLGEHADPAHMLLEPKIRAWFRRHTIANMNKLVSGLEPATVSLELTEDGDTTLPLFVVIRTAWSLPERLANEVAANPPQPIRKGTRFMIAEVVSGQGIRFHSARRRTDDRVTVDGAATIDSAAFDRPARAPVPVAREAQPVNPAHSATLARRAVGALALHAEAQAQRAAERRMARDTLSPRNPVWTTD